MYYQNYEDYIRSVLGYPIEDRKIYNEPNYIDNNIQNKCYQYGEREELEDCYPEMYKTINKVVCDVCNKYNNMISKDMLEDVVEEVYRIVEKNNVTNIKINIENRNDNIIKNNNNSIRNSICNSELKRNVINTGGEAENRQIRNPYLRDLIKILIIKRLLENKYPSRPPRPPFPVRPRSSFVNYNEYFNL